MELQLPHYPSSLLRRKPLVERARPVRTKVVHHHPDALGLRITFIHEPLHLLGELLLRVPLGDRDVPPPRTSLAEGEEVRHPTSPVLIVEALCPSGLSRDGRARLRDELLTLLVEVNHPAQLVVGLGVEVEHLLHAGDVLRRDRRDTPLLLQPRLDPLFFSTRRTVSCEQLSASPHSTTRPASSRIVQRPRPSGAWLHASATSRASAFSERQGRAPGRGRSLMAPSPSSTKRRRVRSTVAWPTPSAVTISASVAPRAAWSRMRARVILRAGVLPRRIKACNSARSSSVRSTIYFFMSGRPPMVAVDQTLQV